MPESTNGNGHLSADDPEVRALAATLKSLESSILLARSTWARQHGLTFGGARDEYEVFGYDDYITTDQYRAAYERGGIAGCIVDVMPDATWRGDPAMELVEDEDPKTETEFEAAWTLLEKRLQINAKFLRVDKLSRLSTYAVLLIGASGDWSTPLPRSRNGGDGLLYLDPFIGGGGPGGRNSSTVAAGADATVFEYETNSQSPRFGRPKSYILKRTDVASPDWGRPVHWTRIHHIAENLLDNEVFGQPALERVWNLLQDLRKVTGGGAEAFWLRANQGLHLDIDKDMAMDAAADTVASLKAQAEDYKHQITRWLRTRGVEVETLGSDVANFAPPADAIITQIAGSKRIPKRILTGSEMGELASSQDRENFRDQIIGRQMQYAGPYIVRPLIDRLIEYGYLPTPRKKEGYTVKWPHIQVLTEQEKVTGAQGWASVNSTMGEVVFTDSEIRDKWAGYEPLTDEQRAEINDRKEEEALRKQDIDVEGAKKMQEVALPEEKVRAASVVPLEERIKAERFGFTALGDVEGHEFHGNQYVTAGGEANHAYVRYYGSTASKKHTERVKKAIESLPKEMVIAAKSPAVVITSLTKGMSAKAIGHYSHEEHQIRIPEKAGARAGEVTIHEMTHAVVAKNPSEFVDVGRAFDQDVKSIRPQDVRFIKHYMESPSEAIAESGLLLMGKRVKNAPEFRRAFPTVIEETKKALGRLGIRLAAESDLRSAQEGTDHKFSSTQVQLPPALAGELLRFGKSLPAFDLCEEEGGLETDAHITVKYGIHTNDAAPVRKALATYVGPIRITLGKTAMFQGDGYDVLYVEVTSPDLVELNRRLADALEVTDTHPVYTPHATVAYLKSGLGVRYVGMTNLEGMSASIGLVRFNPAEGEPVDLRITGRDEKGIFTEASPRAAESVEDLKIVQLMTAAIELGAWDVVERLCGGPGKSINRSLHAEHDQKSHGNRSGGEEQQKKVQRRAITDLFREIKRDVRSQDDIDEISEENGALSFAVRYWGKWRTPPDAEDDEDYDWQELTPESSKKVDALVGKYNKQNPGADLTWSAGEKNWLYFQAGKFRGLSEPGKFRGLSEPGKFRGLSEPGKFRGLGRKERIFGRKERILGGPGSGFHGHKGRPGERGGSTAEDSPEERANAIDKELRSKKEVARRSSNAMSMTERNDPDFLAHLEQVENEAETIFERQNAVAVARGYYEAAKGTEGYPLFHPDGTPAGSLEKHKGPIGGLSEERAALHDEIVDSFITKFRAPLEKPTVVVTGGLPGAGKSVGIRSVPEYRNYLNINADEIKAMLPEYRGANAAFLHEESDMLARRIFEKAVEFKQNLILDVTMKSLGEANKGIDDGLVGRIQHMAKRGYDVQLQFTEVSIDTSVRTALNRYFEEGRFVPPNYIRSARSKGQTASSKNYETFSELRKLPEVDGWVHYTREFGEGPRLYSKGGKQK